MKEMSKLQEVMKDESGKEMRLEILNEEENYSGI